MVCLRSTERGVTFRMLLGTYCAVVTNSVWFRASLLVTKRKSVIYGWHKWCLIIGAKGILSTMIGDFGQSKCLKLNVFFKLQFFYFLETVIRRVVIRSFYKITVWFKLVKLVFQLKIFNWFTYIFQFPIFALHNPLCSIIGNPEINRLAYPQINVGLFTKAVLVDIRHHHLIIILLQVITNIYYVSRGTVMAKLYTYHIHI